MLKERKTIHNRFIYFSFCFSIDQIKMKQKYEKYFFFLCFFCLLLFIAHSRIEFIRFFSLFCSLNWFFASKLPISSTQHRMYGNFVASPCLNISNQQHHLYSNKKKKITHMAMLCTNGITKFIG